MKFKQPSLGTKAAIFLPFLISCTRAHFLMAELGCFASMPLRSLGRQPACRWQHPERACGPAGAHLLQHDALGVGGALEGLLPLVAQVALLIVLVRPPVLSPVLAQLASGSQPPGLPARAQQRQGLARLPAPVSSGPASSAASADRLSYGQGASRAGSSPHGFWSRLPARS